MITRGNYELVYAKLLRELADVDLSKVSADLGGVCQEDQFEMNSVCLRQSKISIFYKFKELTPK